MVVFKEKHGDKIEVLTVNVREHPDIAQAHKVRYVPTIVFFNEQGKVLDRKVGFMTLEALEKEWKIHGYDLTSGKE